MVLVAYFVYTKRKKARLGDVLKRPTFVLPNSPQDTHDNSVCDHIYVEDVESEAGHMPTPMMGDDHSTACATLWSYAPGEDILEKVKEEEEESEKFEV